MTNKVSNCWPSQHFEQSIEFQTQKTSILANNDDRKFTLDLASTNAFHKASEMNILQF